MSAWCDFKGFEGSATFFRAHALEEMDHMQRLFTYVNETGALAQLGQIEAPPTEFDSLQDVFEKTYEHEVEVTRAINGLADTAFQEKDYSTFNFLQWYVAEQHEEETLFKGILDKFEILGTDGKALFMIDREIMNSLPPASIVGFTDRISLFRSGSRSASSMMTYVAV